MTIGEFMDRLMRLEQEAAESGLSNEEILSEYETRVMALQEEVGD